MLVDVTLVRMMEVTLVEVIDVARVAHRRVTAAGTVLIRMTRMLVRRAGSHEFLPFHFDICEDRRAALGRLTEIGTSGRRDPLLITHTYVAVRADRNARKLKKRVVQRNVLIPWLMEQAAMIECVHRRAERRRNLGPLPVEAAGDSRIIRRRRLPRVHSGDKDSHRAQQNDHSRHASNLGWLSTISILVMRAVRPR